MEQEEGQWKNLNNTHLPELFPDRLYILYTVKIIHKGQQRFSFDHRLDRKEPQFEITHRSAVLGFFLS